MDVRTLAGEAVVDVAGKAAAEPEEADHPCDDGCERGKREHAVAETPLEGERDQEGGERVKADVLFRRERESGGRSSRHGRERGRPRRRGGSGSQGGEQRRQEERGRQGCVRRLLE